MTQLHSLSAEYAEEVNRIATLIEEEFKAPQSDEVDLALASTQIKLFKNPSHTFCVAGSSNSAQRLRRGKDLGMLKTYLADVRQIKMAYDFAVWFRDQKAVLGYTNAELAQIVSVTERTIERYIAHGTRELAPIAACKKALEVAQLAQREKEESANPFVKLEPALRPIASTFLKTRVTKKGVRAALKAAGLVQVGNDDKIILAVAKVHQHVAKKHALLTSIKTKAVANKSTEEKLSQIRKHEMRQCFFGFRQDQQGEITVELTNNPGEVGIVQTQRKDWNYYAKSCRFPKVHTDTKITVPTRWRTRVPAHLRNIDGLVTMDLQLCDSPSNDVVIYAAVWAAQGRGYTINCTRGFIAGFGDVWFHAPTFAKAVDGAKRKFKLKRLNEALVSIDRLAQKYPEVYVTREHARLSGSCAYGISNWCHLNNIDEGQTRLGIEQISQLYKNSPIYEVRAAVLYAVKKQIGAKRLLAEDGAN